MRTLYFGANTYQFPDRWEELSKNQFLQLVDALMDYSAGKSNALGCRSTWFCNMAEIDITRRDNQNDIFWENIYRAANLFNFFFEIVYFDKATGERKSISHLPREIRENLQKNSPDQLPDLPEYRWASKLAFRYVIDAVFAKNLLPNITIAGKSFPGYRFNLSGSVLSTSLTARDFIDATMVYNEYVTSHDPENLRQLIGILYFKNVINSEKYISQVPERVSFAILLNFQAILAFLMNKTRYSMIWSRKAVENRENKLSVGVADSIYMLSKQGYGSVNELSSENLIVYLDLLLKNIIDLVQFMNANKSTIEEIATETGLTINQIKKII